MKLASLATAVVLVIGCSDSTVPSSPARSAPPSRTNDNIVNETIPSALVTFNPCNGDVVALVGTTHIVLSATESNGNSSQITFDVSTNYSGVGVPSTLSYTASHTTHNDLVRGNPFPIVQVFLEEMHVVSQTGANNYLLRIHIKVTVNNIGVPTAEILDFKTSCGG